MPRALEAAGVAGGIIEAGCAKGGSAIVLAAAKRPNRRLDVYDTFGLIPPPSDHDGPDVHERYEVIASGRATGRGDATYYGYVPDLKNQVIGSFRALGFPPEQHAIRFHEGRFEDTLRADAPVALAHLDCDWYESVQVCLERIAPRISPGGVVVVDDYEAWSGCQRAVVHSVARTLDSSRRGGEPHATTVDEPKVPVGYSTIPTSRGYPAAFRAMSRRTTGRRRGPRRRTSS